VAHEVGDDGQHRPDHEQRRADPQQEAVPGHGGIGDGHVGDLGLELLDSFGSLLHVRASYAPR
jgi:hypothetical protein